jgi:hypothetical protein
LVLLGTNARSFSLSIWIRPQNNNGGTIIHASSELIDAPWSLPILGFTSSGDIVGQSCSLNQSKIVYGLKIGLNVWTHIVLVFNNSGGLQMWINGTQVVQSNPNSIFQSPNAPMTLTLGYSPTNITTPCESLSIEMNQYQGDMDEFKVFSRVLSSSEIRVIANPQMNGLT